MSTTEGLETKKLEVQSLLGQSPIVNIEHVQNWSTSRKIENLLTVSPTTLEEVQKLVKAARNLKLQVRCGGSLHSWGPLFPDEGSILMYTKALHRHDGPDIELIKISDADIRVNVMSSTTVEQLKEFELENKVNLPSNVVLTEPTYGGIVGTGCHGVGWDYKSMSDFCLQMRVIDCNGELRTYSKESDGDMMAAVQCHMGMFGIIYDMQLQVIPELIARSHNDFSYTAGDIFYNAENLKSILDKNDSVEIFYWPFSSVSWVDASEQITRLLGSNQTLTRDEWDPKNDGCWVRKVNIPDQSTIDREQIKGECYYNYLDIRSWIESKISTVADNFIISMPEVVTPLASKAAYKYAKETNEGEVYQKLVHAIHFRDNIALLSVADTEWAFDTNDDCSNVMQAVQAVIEILRQEAKKKKVPTATLR